MTSPKQEPLFTLQLTPSMPATSLKKLLKEAHRIASLTSARVTFTCNDNEYEVTTDTDIKEELKRFKKASKERKVSDKPDPSSALNTDTFVLD